MESLTSKQIKVINEFKVNIEKIKTSNENKIYLGYFINSLLSQNFWWAANTWFVFLEKFLRTELIFIYHQDSRKWNFLESLDYYEKIFEDGDVWKEKIKSIFEEISSNLKKYKIDKSIDRNQVIEKVESYLNLIDEKGPLEKQKLQFVNICEELRKKWKITKVKSNNLKKLYRKYRNPLHHWLFKRLIDQDINFDKTTVAWVLDWKWVELYEADSSNLILRESWIINDVLKWVSIILFNEINDLLIELKLL